MCSICRHVNAVGFSVPNEVWESVVPLEFKSRVVCLSCFTRMADEKLILWDEDIELYPVSLASHVADVKEQIPGL